MIIYQVLWSDEYPKYFFKREDALKEVHATLIEFIGNYEGSIRCRIEVMLGSGDIDGAARLAGMIIDQVDVR